MFKFLDKKFKFRNKSNNTQSTGSGWNLLNWLTASDSSLTKYSISQSPQQSTNAYKITDFYQYNDVNAVDNESISLYFPVNEFNYVKNHQIPSKSFYYTNYNSKYSIYKSENDFLSIDNFNHRNSLDKYNYLDRNPIKSKLQARFSVGYIESGKSKLYFEQNMYRTPQTLYSQGLTGKRQIVTIFDHGVNTNHSFFYDPNYPELKEGEINQNHRKVIKYHAEDDITPSEHGTHMAGLIAGKSYKDNSMNSMYNGVAPDSKLFIFEDNELDWENIEVAVEEMNELGSYIISNSWSHNAINYEADFEISKLAFENNETIFIFPAGDEARVKSPGDSNNVLTVGSVEGPSNIFNKRVLNGNYIIQSLEQVFNANAKNPCSYNQQQEMVNMNNLKVTVNDEENSLFMSSTCVSTVTNSKFLVYPNNLTCEDTTETETCEKPGVTILIVTVFDFENILKLQTANVTYPYYGFQPSVSEKSARGPGHFGIKKPDILLPGTNILSANSSVNYTDTSLNTLSAMSGTSVSVAQAAGFCALIRQYFVDGYYPSLSPNETNSLKPSSSLIKGILINSAIPLSTKVRDKLTGYGVPKLDDALGFGNFGVRFYDRIPINRSDHKVFTFTTTKYSDFRITMTYLDTPNNNTELDGIPLNVDLNMIVVQQDGNYYLGNMMEEDYHEALSTVEKIIINNLEPQTLTIHIYSNEYNNDNNPKIEFSLSIMGGFDTNDETVKLEETSKAQIVNRCSGNSHDENGICQCPYNRFGDFCQIQAYVIEGNILTMPIYNDHPIYFTFDITLTQHYSPIFRQLSKPPYQPDFFAIYIGVGNKGIAESIYRLVVAGTYNDGLYHSEPYFYDKVGPHYMVVWNFDTDTANIRLGVSHKRVPAPTQTPSMTPDTTPIETPSMTPYPSETPSMTPDLTPVETPATTPDKSPIATPETTPDKSPVETPSSTPGTTPDKSPVATPETTPNTTPIETPSSTPGTTPLPSTIPATQSAARTVIALSPDDNNYALNDNNVKERIPNRILLSIIIITCLVLLVVSAFIVFLVIKHRSKNKDNSKSDSFSHEYQSYNSNIEEFQRLGLDDDLNEVKEYLY